MNKNHEDHVEVTLPRAELGRLGLAFFLKPPQNLKFWVQGLVPF